MAIAILRHRLFDIDVIIGRAGADGRAGAHGRGRASRARYLGLRLGAGGYSRRARFVMGLSVHSGRSRKRGVHALPSTFNL
jgi:hypothetical protein